MQCPKCKESTLIRGKVKNTGVEIDYCGSCKGFWLDNGELQKVMQTAAKTLTVPFGVEQATLCCPKCKNLLYTAEYPQTLVEIEICRTCKGIWIDAGELKEIETVRSAFLNKGKLADEDIPGPKGTLVRFINNAIDYLMAC